MSRYFSTIVDRYLNHWIALPTWGSKHPLDMQRFYQFLRALKRYSRKDWTLDFRERIFRAAKDNHPEFDESYLVETIDYFVRQEEIICDYHSAPFPAPLVEMSNPYLVASYLSLLLVVDDEGNERSMYTSEEIEEILAKNFGKDWRNHERWRI